MMKIQILTLAIMTIGINSYAEYTVKIGAGVQKEDIQFVVKETPTDPEDTWIEVEPQISDWINKGSAYNCTNWTPSEHTYNKGESFTQKATDCDINQERNIYKVTENTRTGEKKVSELYTSETRTIKYTETRIAIGTKNPEECGYSGTTYFMDYSSSQTEGAGTPKGNYLVWNNAAIYYKYTPKATTPFIQYYELNGYRYTKNKNDPARKSMGSVSGGYAHNYSICREKINQ